MTREDTKKLLPVIQAYAEGKTVQVIDGQCRWVDVENEPDWDGFSHWRIKPEPREWWIVETTGNHVFTSLSSAACFSDENHTAPIVHVREVIE